MCSSTENGNIIWIRLLIKLDQVTDSGFFGWGQNKFISLSQAWSIFGKPYGQKAEWNKISPPPPPSKHHLDGMKDSNLLICFCDTWPQTALGLVVKWHNCSLSLKSIYLPGSSPNITSFNLTFLLLVPLPWLFMTSVTIDNWNKVTSLKDRGRPIHPQTQGHSEHPSEQLSASL